MRCFIGTFVDAVGAVPEPTFLDSDPAFRAATVGRTV